MSKGANGPLVTCGGGAYTLLESGQIPLSERLGLRVELQLNGEITEKRLTLTQQG